MRRASAILLLSVFATGTATAGPVTYSGVTFPGGDESFADRVVSYTPGSDVGAGYNDPQDALGAPDFASGVGSTSLGEGGELILEFTDNSLTTSGDATEDLWIFEIGAAVESFNVAIAQTLGTWIDLGDIRGQPSGIDIDSVAGVVSGARYSYVRLRDVLPNESGSPFGEADIDAVGAISSAAPVPGPTALWLLVIALTGLRFRRRRG